MGDRAYKSSSGQRHQRLPWLLRGQHLLFCFWCLHHEDGVLCHVLLDRLSHHIPKESGSIICGLTTLKIHEPR